VSRPVIANLDDPAFRQLSEFLKIPAGTIEYRLEFVANGVVMIETRFELPVVVEGEE
jgi:hypothetical protein